ncbi:4'-phosphopantetheinyl transferase superfamily protein [Streptomyces bohaiensis]|uniref:4'-phosphopantetheinyl transferase superfamily protein n=1 Tax=Streptomyces bohaiensis TaxID=1431344 RepID=UPI003B76D552
MTPTPVPPAVAGLTLRVAIASHPLPVTALTPGEARQYARLTGGHRRRLWLTARRALRGALAAAGLDTDTSVHGFPQPRASLSYAGDLAVAVVAAGGASALSGLGADIELRTPAPGTARFFLTDREQDHLAALPAPRRPASLLRLWTVKEALYKADPDNARTRLRDYALDDPGARAGTARTVRAPTRDLPYLTLDLSRGCFSVAATPSHTGVPPVSEHTFAELAPKIAAFVSLPVEEITPGLRLADLALDSMASVELVVDLQEDYDIVLSRDDFATVETLGDLAALISSRLPDPADH